MDFKVGDKVVYPNHGVGVIEQVTKKAVGDMVSSFYCLRIISTDSTVMVPVGNTIAVALRVLTTLPPKAGKRLPGAIVLLSDGASNVGVDPITEARRAKSLHIPIYTISLGTPNGEIPIQISHGSTLDQTTIILAAPPLVHP